MKHVMALVWIFLLISMPAAADDLATLKAKVMAADYRADIAELARLRDELQQRKDDGPLTYLARYWSGFASWRMAINGAGNGMKGEELKANLQNAAVDFYASMRLKSDFADAYAAASLVNGWLGVFSMKDDPALLRERLALYMALLSRAGELDANNPRVLWAKASPLVFGPKPDIPAAIEIYRTMLKESERRGVDPHSPLPDWGKPEALMSLAFAHMQQSPADVAAAREEATAALKVVPEWAYVRDKLMKRIEGKQ